MTSLELDKLEGFSRTGRAELAQKPRPDAIEASPDESDRIRHSSACDYAMGET